MQQIKDIMTRDVAVAQLDDTLQTAAQTMQRLNIGALPVCEGDTLAGMLTDRDITVRGVAAGLNPTSALVRQVMSGDVLSCHADDTVDQVMAAMGSSQVRRLAVLGADRRIVGIIALADLATRQAQRTDAILRSISAPAPLL